MLCLQRAEAMADGLPYPAPPPPTDPRLPLSPLQVFKLKKSWKGIKRSIELTGVEMFVRMFRTEPFLKDMFKDFRNLVTDDEMRENMALEKHATMVMNLLDEAINNIDNVDLLLDLLHRVGKNHLRFEGFDVSYFWLAEQPLLEAIKITLGDRYTENMDIIYKLVIRFLLTEITKACRNDVS
ncbi:neuroglobin [Octopus bimaculoides]|nr:neuroglobin [Octopus bimaculoides]|eukprot:XP_014785608.1 PREDICTED: neuroglobin-like [Octopus bimaculoides]